MIYNYKDKTLNFANLKATDYKYNKRIFMPEPDSAEIETLHEVRRTEMRKIFSRVSKPPVNSHQSNMSKSNNTQSVNSKESKLESFESIESNLSKKEIFGLKSLRQRIKRGELIIGQTDKSKNLGRYIFRDTYSGYSGEFLSN